ncbi:RDD family protein [Rudaeicoccus suwonensis]|uniref:Putative RDD family membrane protein YckC n=1 Tax=Rudaeicoccus suwonensis TaxID=657409 RepID=A0A561E9A4_9MICO|nr:RDD family protein [Rudaeicoccus suwonensis]TWE12192.1 putative RDD family membrane protein YckC [Rudaeicoccus suwonensis]
MTDRPSGWYDDPDSPDQLRYWDGILWSDRTMPKVKPGLEDSHIGDPREQWDREHQDDEQHVPYGAAPFRGQQPGRPTGWGPGAGSHYDPRQGHYPQVQATYPPLPVPTTPDGEQLSGWWRRLVAFCIDGIIVFTVAVALAWHWLQPWVHTVTTWYDSVVTAAENHQSQPPTPSGFYDVPWQYPVVVFLIYLVYEVCLTVWRGQTLGKMVTGIRVRGADSTAPPSLRAATIRLCIKQGAVAVRGILVLSTVGLLFQVLDGLVPLGDARKQAIHDKGAKTYVVRTNPTSGHYPQQGGPSPYNNQSSYGSQQQPYDGGQPPYGR